MNSLKFPLIALSLAIPLVIGNINPVPALGAPLIAQSQTDTAYQLIERGLDYLDRGQWDYALEAFNQAISLDESNPYGYVGRATAIMYKTPEPTLLLVKLAEKDLQTAISLMSPTEDTEAYQTVQAILKMIQLTRTVLELGQ